jgi:Na+-driven multidrug efflux pump
LGDAIRGAGKAIVPMAIVILNMCVARIMILYLVMHNMNEVRGIAMVYPITWMTTSLCMYTYYKKVNWLGEEIRKEVNVW